MAIFSNRSGIETSAPARRVFLAFITLIALLMYLPDLSARFYANGDATWHVSAGQLILESGAVPRTDPWSFTAGDYAWINLSWLYDVLIALVHDAAGRTGLVVAHALLAAGMVAFMANICFRRSCGPIATFVAALALIVGLQPVANVRPQLVSMAFAAIFYWLLDRQRRGKAVNLLLAFGLCVVWANLHGGYAALVPLLGAFGVDALWRRQKEHVWRIVLIGLLAVLAGMITPYGVGTYEGIARAMGSDFLQRVVEWHPANFTVSPQLFMVFVLLAAASPLMLRPLPVADVVLAVGWFGLSLTSMRYAPFFALLATPLLAMSLHARMSESRWGKAYHAKARGYIRDFSGRGAWVAAGIFALVLSVSVVTPGVRQAVWEKSVKPSLMPFEEVAYLAKHHAGARVFNLYDYGGLMIYQSAGLKPFVDSRERPVYPARVMQDYFHIAEFEEGWQALLNSYKPQVVLWPNAEPRLYLFERQGWRKEFTGPVATVFVRR